MINFPGSSANGSIRPQKMIDGSASAASSSSSPRSSRQGPPRSCSSNPPPATAPPSPSPPGTTVLGALGFGLPEPGHGARGPHVLGGLAERPQRHVELERPLPRAGRRRPPGRHPRQPAVLRRSDGRHPVRPPRRPRAPGRPRRWTRTSRSPTGTRRTTAPTTTGSTSRNRATTPRPTRSTGPTSNSWRRPTKILPGVGRPPASGGGTLVDIPVSAPGRSGHHVVYMIWQASHFDQSFYSCSDVWFGEGQPDPTITPAEPTPTGDDPTSEDPTEEPTTGGPAGYECAATATVNGWGSGATRHGDRCPTPARRPSTTGCSTGQWPQRRTLSTVWNAEHSTMGGMEMAEPVSWNKAIAVGGSVQFGLQRLRVARQRAGVRLPPELASDMKAGAGAGRFAPRSRGLGARRPRRPSSGGAPPRS